MAEVDLSGLSFAELVALKGKIDQQLWASNEWQEVTVPQGIYKVGVDIPAGKWTVRCSRTGKYNYLSFCNIEVGRKLSADGMSIVFSSDGYHTFMIYDEYSDNHSEGNTVEVVLNLMEGTYVSIDPIGSPAMLAISLL